VRGREGAKGGGAKLLERADMSGVSSNFVKKFVWVIKVVLGFQKFCKIKTTHLEMVKNHETF
jgi:hypothetical protein